MKATELRIGNWMYSAKRKIPFEITVDDLKIIDEGNSLTEPIPLTEEWLIKFGFDNEVSKEDGWTITIDKDWCYLTIDTEGGAILWDNSENLDRGNYPTIRVLKHVHELQNLYFALTGEELKTK